MQLWEGMDEVACRWAGPVGEEGEGGMAREVGEKEERKGGMAREGEAVASGGIKASGDKRTRVQGCIDEKGSEPCSSLRREGGATCVRPGIHGLSQFRAAHALDELGFEVLREPAWTEHSAREVRGEREGSTGPGEALLLGLGLPLLSSARSSHSAGSPPGGIERKWEGNADHSEAGRGVPVVPHKEASGGEAGVTDVGLRR